MQSAEGKGEGDPSHAVGSASDWPIVALAFGLAISAVVLTTRAMGLSAPPRSAWRLNPGASLLLFILLIGIGPQGGEALATMFDVAADDTSLRASVIHAAGSFALQMLLLAAIVAARRKGLIFDLRSEADQTGEVVRPAWSRGSAAALGVVALAIAWFPLQSVGSIAASIQLYFGGAQPPAEGHSTFELLRTSPSIALNCAMVVIVLACAPITEEVAFRGGLMRAMRGMRIPAWTSIALTSVLFAAVHVPALTAGAMASGLATLFALAVVLGWLMERTGRITAPIVAHALFNLINLILFWTA